MSPSRRVARIEVLGQWRAGARLHAEWEQLALAQDNVFATPEWFEAWGAVASRGRPHALIARDGDGRLLGVLPLIEQRRAGLVTYDYPAAAFTDVVAPPCRPGAEPLLAEAWLEELAARGMHRTLLERIDGERWLGPLARAAASLGLRSVRRSPAAVLPYIDLGAGYDGWAASRSRNFRSQLGRRRRRLEGEYGATFRRADATTLAGDLDSLFDLHNRRWDSADGSSALPAWSLPFHRAFAGAALERGWLRLHLLEVEGRPIAAFYGWRHGSRYYYYQSGFDPDEGRLGPGGVLLAHTIAEAASEGARTYDMLWGDEAYKERYATGHRTATSMLVAPRASAPGLAVAAAARCADAARALPPPLRSPLRIARQAFHRVAGRSTVAVVAAAADRLLG
jgi:CelD/BcsL family acetyltransferase involved in cellulose biosynthesis